MWMKPWNGWYSGGTEHGAIVIRQFMITLLKAFGYLKKMDRCFWEFYWVVKCQTSVVPPIPCQEFLNRILYHQKCNVSKGTCLAWNVSKNWDPLPLRWPVLGLHRLSSEKVFPNLRSEPARTQFLILPLVLSSVSKEKFGTVVTIISLQVREISVGYFLAGYY